MVCKRSLSCAIRIVCFDGALYRFLKFACGPESGRITAWDGRDVFDPVCEIAFKTSAHILRILCLGVKTRHIDRDETHALVFERGIYLILYHIVIGATPFKKTGRKQQDEHLYIFEGLPGRGHEIVAGVDNFRRKERFEPVNFAQLVINAASENAALQVYLSSITQEYIVCFPFVHLSLSLPLFSRQTEQRRFFSILYQADRHVNENGRCNAVRRRR